MLIPLLSSTPSGVGVPYDLLSEFRAGGLVNRKAQVQALEASFRGPSFKPFARPPSLYGNSSCNSLYPPGGDRPVSL